MARTFVTCVVVSLLATACGGNQPTEEKREQIEKAADQVQDSAASMAKGLEEMAKGIGALGGGDPNVKPVDPVSFRELQTVLPEISGWERSKPTGERMTSPVNFSQTSVRFTKGDASIEQKIVDSALNQLLVAPFAMFLASGYEKETESGYEKSVKVGEYPGWEKWSTESRNGELNVIVNRRFIVQVEGHGVDDMKVLHNVMAQTDLKKLAALK